MLCCNITRQMFFIVDFTSSNSLPGSERLLWSREKNHKTCKHITMEATIHFNDFAKGLMLWAVQVRDTGSLLIAKTLLNMR